MSAALAALPRGFLARYEAGGGRLSGDRAARAAAARALAAGFPGPHDEAWRYTSLRPLAEHAWAEPPVATPDPAALLARFDAIDAPRIVFVNGGWREDLSRPPAHWRRPDRAGARSGARPGTLARPEREPMVALNTLFAEDGALIELPAGVDGGTVLLLHLALGTAEAPFACHPRHRIRLGAGARLALVEASVGEGVYLHNPVTEILLGEHAVLSHARLQDEAAGGFHLATLYGTLARGAHYDGFLLALGARLSRAEAHVTLEGEGGRVHLNGGQLLAGTQHADFTSVVRHAAPACASRQTVKSVLGGMARGVFQGRIEVAREAQKTDGYQRAQALLLSPDAEVDIKPELEIFADDVKCSHGATVGALDAEQIFYLRSRGIPAAEARAMLVRGFLAEALADIAAGPARTMLEQAVELWWRRQQP